MSTDKTTSRFKSIGEYLSKPQRLRFAMMSSSVVGLLAKGFGFGRYIITAYAFGLSARMDAFYMAMSLMEITVFIFGNTADILGIPQLVKASSEKGDGYFRELTGTLMAFSLALTILSVVTSFLVFKPLMWILAPGFDADKIALTRSLLPYFLPMALFYVPYYTLNAVLKSLRRFRISVATDFSISFFSFMLLLLTYRHDFVWVPLSLGFAYMIAFMIQLIAVCKIKAIEFPKSLRLPEMSSIFGNSLYLIVLTLISQSYRVIDKSFASLLTTGSITALSYALSFTAPVVTTLSYSGVLLTGFSESNKDSSLFKKGLLVSFLVGLPISCFLYLNGIDLIGFFLQRGMFAGKATMLTGSLLRIYSLIIPCSLGMGVVFSKFQSASRFKVIVGLSTLNMTLNALINWALVRRLGAAGIVWGTVIASYTAFGASSFFLEEAGETFRAILKNILSLALLCLPIAFLTIWIPMPFLVRSVIYFGTVYGTLIYFDHPRELAIQSTIRSLLPSA